MASTTASGNRFGKAFTPRYLGERAEHMGSALPGRPAPSDPRPETRRPSAGRRRTVRGGARRPGERSPTNGSSPIVRDPASATKRQGQPLADHRKMPRAEQRHGVRFHGSDVRGKLHRVVARARAIWAGNQNHQRRLSCGSRTRVADRYAGHACVAEPARATAIHNRPATSGHAVRAFKAVVWSVAEHREVLEVEPWPDRAPHERVRPGRAGGLPVAGVNSVHRRLVAGQWSKPERISDARSADSCSSSSGAPS